MKNSLLLLAVVFITINAHAQISVSPNTACAGETISVTITGINYAAASSGCGNLNTSQAGLTSGSNTNLVLNPSNVTGVAGTPTTMTFTIPLNFTPGVYGFNVENDCDAKGSCSNCFTVETVPAQPSITPNGTLLTSSSATGVHNWYLDGVQIQGETASTYTAVQSGNYTVEVLNNCGPSLLSPPVNIVISSVTTGDNKLAIIYPNPVSDYMVVENPNQLPILLEMYDITGALLNRRLVVKQDAISMKSLPTGLYIVKLSSGTSTAIQKIVKN